MATGHPTHPTRRQIRSLKVLRLPSDHEFVVMATVFTVVDGRVSRIYSVVNPNKLAALDIDDPIG